MNRLSRRRLTRGVVALLMIVGTMVSAVPAAWGAQQSGSQAPEVSVRMVQTDRATDADFPLELRLAYVKVSPSNVEMLNDEVAPGVQTAAAQYGYTFSWSGYNVFGTRLFAVHERVEWTGTSISLHTCWGTSGLATYRSCSKWTGSPTFGASWIFSVGPWGWPQYDPYTQGRVYSDGRITITFYYVS